ncbi:MAG TPA: hypothetical protein DHU96_15810 [Actinobacteria bacterium]|nr:hypothetical protein [Actinomycetota bacterium]
MSGSSDPVAIPEAPGEDTGNWSVSELMTVSLARELRDGEVTVMGTASAIPQAACRLAQLTHAPSLWYVAGGTCSVNPYLAPLVPSACDFELLRAETAVPLNDIVLLEGRGDVFDTFFAGGIQVDAYGNCNLVAVGSWDRPSLRGPGSVGLPFLGRVGRVLIYTASHNPKTFVEKVDFVSGPGYLGGPRSWRAARLPGGGPALVVTPLCTMDFDPVTLRARLRSVHPGVDAGQVRAGTGFELGGPRTVPVTPAPTRAELAILRRLDPRGVLR